MLDKNKTETTKTTNFNINTNMTGGALQQNIGQEGGTVSQTVNNAAEVTVEQVLTEVEKALPEEKAAEFMPELRKFASLPIEEQEEPEVKGRLATILAKIVEWQPTVQKNLAIFGVGALESLATLNPIINGIWHLCKASANSSATSDMPASGDSWGSGVTRR